MTLNLGATTAKVSPFTLNTQTTAASSNAPSALNLIAPVASTAAPASGLSFGTLAKPTTAASASGFTFGANTNTTSAPSLLPAPAASVSFGFGGTSSAGTGFGLPTTSTTATNNFGFGSVAKPGFFAPPASTTTSQLGAAGTSSFAFSANPSVQTAAAPAFKGLGGVNATESGGASTTSGSTATRGDGKRGKECEIPAEVAQTVETFKKHLAELKVVRDALSKHTERPFLKVREDLNLLKAQLVEIANRSSRNNCQIKKLKANMAEEDKNVLIAKRTFETPPGLQYENTAPVAYFGRVIQAFETRLINYKQEIENVEGLLATSDAHNGIPPQELYQTLKRLHDGFVVVASDLYTVHEHIRLLKSSYLKFRRLLGDTTNPFVADSVQGLSGQRSGPPATVVPSSKSAASGDGGRDMPPIDPQRLFNTWMGIGAVVPPATGATPGAQPGPPGVAVTAAGPTAHSLLQGALAAAAGSGGTAPGAAVGGLGQPARLGGTAAGPAAPGPFSFGSGLGSTSTAGSLNLFGTPSGALGAKPSSGTSGLNLFTSNSLSNTGFQLQSPPVGKKKR